MSPSGRRGFALAGRPGFKRRAPTADHPGVEHAHPLTPEAEVAVAAFEAGRVRDDERLTSLIHPEAELVPLTAMVPYRGPEGAREWLRTVTARYRGWAGRYDRVECVGREVILHGVGDPQRGRAAARRRQLALRDPRRAGLALVGARLGRRGPRRGAPPRLSEPPARTRRSLHGLGCWSA